jgi:5'-nucleotidase
VLPIYIPREGERTMRILLCNDDGYQAQGLRILRAELESAGHTVFVVAPHEERSGQSHAMTFFRPLLTKQVEERVWAVFGTPADCATIGIQVLMKGIEPDIVLSGINFGLNVGWDVNYSGTVGAATEAALLGFRAIATSVDVHHEMSKSDQDAAYLRCAKLTVKVLAESSKLAWKECEVLNINVPSGEIRGVVQAECGGYSMYVPAVRELKNPETTKDTRVFMLGGSARRQNGDKTQDVTLVQEGYATLSFLQARQHSVEKQNVLSELIQRL